MQPFRNYDITKFTVDSTTAKRYCSRKELDRLYFSRVYLKLISALCAFEIFVKTILFDFSSSLVDIISRSFGLLMLGHEEYCIA